jgi:hypothetical protein
MHILQTDITIPHKVPTRQCPHIGCERTISKDVIVFQKGISQSEKSEPTDQKGLHHADNMDIPVYLGPTTETVVAWDEGTEQWRQDEDELIEEGRAEDNMDMLRQSFEAEGLEEWLHCSDELWRWRRE